MTIAQHVFADLVVSHVREKVAPLRMEEDGSEVVDHWTLQRDGGMKSEEIPAVGRGMFTQVYKAEVVLPAQWQEFCEQFYSPETRLLLALFRECQKRSWLNWSSLETPRDDFPLTGHFWTKRHQTETYIALVRELKGRGITTTPNRTYRDDRNAFGVKMADRVVDFPGSYNVLQLMVDEVLWGIRYNFDLPRDHRRYGASKPMLHMIGDTVEKNDVLTSLIASSTLLKPKKQQVVYVFSELRGTELVHRRIGYLMITALEVHHQSLVGAIHWDIRCIVPRHDLSPDEIESLPCSSDNWNLHCDTIVKRCPAIVRSLNRAA